MARSVLTFKNFVSLEMVRYMTFSFLTFDWLDKKGQNDFCTSKITCEKKVVLLFKKVFKACIKSHFYSNVALLRSTAKKSKHE